MKKSRSLLFIYTHNTCDYCCVNFTQRDSFVFGFRILRIKSTLDSSNSMGGDEWKIIAKINVSSLSHKFKLYGGERGLISRAKILLYRSIEALLTFTSVTRSEKFSANVRARCCSVQWSHGLAVDLASRKFG